ncbi:hypothetical protein Tco_0053067, partial [Tanacetum coccineum]
MLPEWGRFVTVMKLNRGLRDSNYDQLYAYLKQHEAHANENKMMLERFTQPNVDPIALMSNVLHQQYHSQSSTTLPSTHIQPHFADNPQLDSGLSPTDNLIELNQHSYHTHPIIQNIPSSNQQSTQNFIKCKEPSHSIVGYRGAQNRVENANPGQARQIKCYNCNAQENGVALDEEQLLFIAGGQDNAGDCDAFDSDIDEAPTVQTMFMVNLSYADPVFDEASPSYDLDILFEVPNHNNYQDAVCEHHEVHEMH